MILRDHLRTLDADMYGRFVAVAEVCSEILETVEAVFPSFTRHDPSHVEKLETLVPLILRGEALDALSAADLLLLLSALWVHDTGMGIVPALRLRHSATSEYQELLKVFGRKGEDEEACWREYARARHHEFCPDVVSQYLTDHLTPFERHWVGAIAQSHGERTLHDRAQWPKQVAVGDGAHCCPPVLAVALRLADILHMNEARAPEYLLEHRHICDLMSVAHWRGHQVAADLAIQDGTCFFDGVTSDDEAYWFAQQFITAMDQELRYCRREVLPVLDPPMSDALTFSRVENRVIPHDFIVEAEPRRLEVNGPRLLKDLLGDALYAGKPAWFRELIQNAFDACRDRKEVEPSCDPSVYVQFDTEKGLVGITDTGVGMTAETVARYLLVAASSYWSSAEYLSTRNEAVGHVGTFGVGFMSVFSVADEVTITTRHYQEKGGRVYRIRSPNRIVRTELAGDAPIGTCVELHLASASMLELDPEALLRETCPFAEFPVSLAVDGTTVQSLSGNGAPALSDGLQLRKVSEGARATRLLAVAIRSPGLEGTLHVPKIFLKSLGAHIPDMRGWIRQAGWQWEGEASTHLGGVKYPALHALDGNVLFSHLPSIGALRVSVSPTEFAPEMNLARDRFVSGPETRRLHRSLCRVLDEVLAVDLAEEIEGAASQSMKSAVVARYSACLLHLWLGNAPRLSAWIGRPDLHPEPVDETPFPGLTSLAADTLRFGVVDRSQRHRFLTIAEMEQKNSVLFSPGLVQGGQVSKVVAEAIWTFNSEALLLVTLPDVSFGILELRYWASEEFLVPVLPHQRCAYGVRLGPGSRPYPLFPSELSAFGLPIASGPPEFALLDHRDFMAEAKGQPTGGPQITAVLNRYHPAIEQLAASLNARRDITELRRDLGVLRHELWRSFEIGRDNQYDSGAGTKLASTIATMCELLEIPVSASDLTFPRYHDGGSVTPFGRFNLPPEVFASLQELEQLEAPFVRLS